MAAASLIELLVDSAYPCRWSVELRGFFLPALCWLLLAMANQTRMAGGSSFSRSARYWHDGVGVDYTPDSLVCDGAGVGF